jgi:hypothetical protein
MCDNPLCDICHEAGATDAKDDRPRPAGIARATISGIGAITLFMAVMAGATAIGLWQLAPASLHLPG